MKKLLLSLVIAFGLIFMAGCTLTPNSTNKSTEAKEAVSCISLDINPEIEIMIDEDDVVVEVYANNDDAKVLLLGEVSLEGKTLEEVLEILTELCVKAGYLDENNKVIDFTVTSTVSEEKVKELKEKVDSKIKAKAEKLGFEIKLTNKGVFSLIRQLEKLKEENPDNQLIQDLSVEKFRLILSAQSSDPTLTLEVAVTLNEKELIDLIVAARDEVYNVATDEFNKKVEEAKNEYHNALRSHHREAYSKYYKEHSSKHFLNYGALYHMYGKAADAIETVIRITNKFNEMRNATLSEEQVNKVVENITKLGVAQEEVLANIKDENGNVTLDSISAYLDKLVKNMDSEAIKTELEDLKDSINEIENTVEEQFKHVDAMLKPRLQMMVTSLKTTYTSIEAFVNSMSALVPENILNVYKTYLADVKTFLDTVEQNSIDGITLDDLHQLLATLREKEAELLEKIHEELSEEELKEIEDFKKELPNDLEDYKGEFENQMNEAKEEVEKKLEDLKSKRGHKHGR